MRVLIVDDDQDLLEMLEYGLEKLGPEFEIVTARNMAGAMAEVEKEWFDLVLTDYMMPGMTGVDLARAVRRMSPDTHVILMTAYSTNRLRETSYYLDFDGFLSKPFDINQIRTVVRQTAQQLEKTAPVESETSPPSAPETTPAPAEPPTEPAALDKKLIEPKLDELLVNAGARGALLISVSGQPLKQVGQLDSAKVTQISSLIATTFSSVAQLSHLLDNQKLFKANFFEGEAYNLYVCQVNAQTLLAVIFESKLRSGVIWFYAKQTAAELAPLVES